MSDFAGQRPFEGAGTALFVRGGLAILFAIAVMIWPGATVLALIYLFGFYAGMDGITNIVHYFSDRPRRSAWALVGGIVSVLAGIVAFAWPAATAVSLAVVIGAWALVLGVTQIALSLEAKKMLKSWWTWLASGIVTALFGLYVLILPGAGILSLLGLLAAFAFLFGILLLTAGFQLRGFAAGAASGHRGATPSTP
ncbi:HdeD family acid-resistance protein [Arthrobacter sp. NPDC057013]|uniref:HdeD family acid-resistance protein n=1 Tax=Arthrobacter sp. NPDC057013 TaxID=3345999 RepID=UPI00363AB4CD